MIFSLRETLIQREILNGGYYHLQISNISDEELKNVELNKDFNTLAIVKDLGISLESSKASTYSYAHLYSMTEDTFNILKKSILKGTFPKNSNEILLNELYASLNDIEIGDNVKFTVGDMVDGDGNIIYDYMYGNSYIVNGKDYEFTVVGTTKNMGLFITTGIDSSKNDVYLTLKDVRNYKEDIAQILGQSRYGEETSKYYDNYYINKYLLKYEIFDMSEEMLGTFTKIATVIIFIILITSVVSIRNSFAISTSEKTKMYGMLASVGATKKQIKKMVIYEGFLIGTIGIILGILLGVGVSYLLIYIVNLIAKNGNLLADDFRVYYKFSVVPIIIASLVSNDIIYLSVITCARRASKTSPIQNIRNAENLKSKKIKLKVPKYIQQLFKIGGVISYKNLKRSKKKYRVTVISLTVSIFVFITISSLVEYGNKAIKDRIINMKYNISVNDTSSKSKSNFLNAKTFNNIINEDVSYVTYYIKNKSYYLLDTSKVLKKQNIITVSRDDLNGIKEFKFLNSTHVIYDSSYFKEYVEKLGLNYSEVKDKAIVLNTYKENDSNGKVTYGKITDYKVGDSLEFTDLKTNEKMTYKIAAITDEKPVGEEYSNSFIVVLNKEYVNEELYPSVVYFNSKNPNDLEIRLKKNYDGLLVKNMSSEVDSMKSLLLIASIFVYGFIIVVSLIGITSVFNTITSNMELRKREFAMIKSIGMTKEQFNKMIYLEAFFYSFKSLVRGIILGIIGSIIVYKIFAKNWEFRFPFPIYFSSYIYSICDVNCLFNNEILYVKNKQAKYN